MCEWEWTQFVLFINRPLRLKRRYRMGSGLCEQRAVRIHCSLIFWTIWMFSRRLMAAIHHTLLFLASYCVCRSRHLYLYIYLNGAHLNTCPSHHCVAYLSAGAGRKYVYAKRAEFNVSNGEYLTLGLHKRRLFYLLSFSFPLCHSAVRLVCFFAFVCIVFVYITYLMNGCCVTTRFMH